MTELQLSSTRRGHEREPPKVSRSYYSASLSEFRSADPRAILGILVASHGYSVEDLQRNAWAAQISILRSLFAQEAELEGHLFFEFAIPRMGRRVDLVIIYRRLVFIVEFKVGETDYPRYALDQAHDYALDLKNFHSGSHHRSLVPILVATEANPLVGKAVWSTDSVCEPLTANKVNLLNVIRDVASQCNEPDIQPNEWESSKYRPTPTIIEAAQALYRGHGVEAMSRSDSGAINLGRTAFAIGKAIDTAKVHREKAICFVTGVPGSGKTLAGLNIATKRHNIDQGEHAVFLSGNAPLVAVLREALARDEIENKKRTGVTIRRKDALRKAESFIQNIHHFRDDALRTDSAPVEKVVIFDEAQRAWTKSKTEKFMAQKKGIANFGMSEPEFLISVLDRHSDYAVIICLVGGGQEINDGEAGLPEWFESIKTNYPEWKVYVSDCLSEVEYTRGGELLGLIPADKLVIDEDLHLAVPIRSFRSERVSSFVKATLDEDVSAAKSLAAELLEKYPICLTRDIDSAREWLRSRARGTERFGIVASSGALRLKPEGINVKAKISPEYWFLNSKDDVRSCYYLEDVATEFDIQGLELDWACVAWDADFRMNGGSWEYWRFRGTRWTRANDPLIRTYLKNSYRVLLTRARQGMVIFVPKGDAADLSRSPIYYDSTFSYFREIGIPVI
jgi:hypothetical protein